MKPLLLHAHTSGPNPYKVGILLENLKIPYEVKLWEFGDGENGLKGPVFTKINENGRVPALGYLVTVYLFSRQATNIRQRIPIQALYLGSQGP